MIHRSGDGDAGARSAAPRPAPSRPPAWRRLVRALLRVSLYYKILLANAVLVGAGIFLGGWVASTYLRTRSEASLFELIALLAVAGVALSLVINAAILRLALRPLADLEEAAERVHRGEFTARARISPLADRDLERVIRTQNEMLDTLDHYRSRLRDVAARAQNAAEEERKRVARELHDETGQALAAILVRLRLLERAEDDVTRRELVRELRDQAAEALEGVRRFARGLRPPALDDLGLVAAVANHARGIERTGELEITVVADDFDAEGLAPEAELTIYRNIQEALSNVLRHAHATRAEIRLSREGDDVVAVIEDDGRGFSPEAVERAGTGLGIFGMKERAEYLDGELTIDSAPGRGTRVVVRIPARR